MSRRCRLSWECRHDYTVQDNIATPIDEQPRETMVRRVLIPGVTAGIVLFGLSYLVLYATIYFMPSLVVEYYNPVFWPGNERALLFFAHPFVISFALAWFWDRFKLQVSGPWLLRGLQFGLVYALIATLPSMWIIFSAIDVSLTMVLTWFAYGLMQALVCGVIMARMNP